jgi:hypothetical protein
MVLPISLGSHPVAWSEFSYLVKIWLHTMGQATILISSSRVPQGPVLRPDVFNILSENTGEIPIRFVYFGKSVNRQLSVSTELLMFKRSLCFDCHTVLLEFTCIPQAFHTYRALGHRRIPSAILAIS